MPDVVNEPAPVPPLATVKAVPRLRALRYDVPLVAVMVPVFRNPIIVVVEKIEVDDA